MSSHLHSSIAKAFLAVMLLGVFSLLTTSLHAQTAAPGAAPGAAAPGTPDAGTGTPDATAAAASQTPTTLTQLFVQGGPVMYALVLASICVFWFTGEGFYTLRAGKLAPKALIARLREAFSSGNYQEAWKICRSNKCFLSNVLGAGLERVGRGKDAVEFAVEETALREATILRTNTTYLSVIGVVSPMIGLTGTVWGMLAGNIGEVLVATASGLLVAIPAFVFFYILKARAQGAILFAESQVNHLLDEVPYEQLTGVRIGENFSADQAGKLRSARSGTSQKVSRTVTTNCPSCNAPIMVGTTPCPNCGTVLDWGS
jgi:biopolymer transport protein ExbB